MILFKSSLIQSLYNLSDDQLDYQIVDRVSFKRFLGLKKSDKVPDSKTVWNFREQLINKNVILSLFKTFNKPLHTASVSVNEANILHATFLQLPRHHNTRKENKHITETGTAPKECDAKPNKKRQNYVHAHAQRIIRLLFTCIKPT